MTISNNTVIQRMTPITDPAMIPTEEPPPLSLTLCATDTSGVSEVVVVIVVVSLVDTIEVVVVTVVVSLVDTIEVLNKVIIKLLHFVHRNYTDTITMSSEDTQHVVTTLPNI